MNHSQDNETEMKSILLNTKEGRGKIQITRKHTQMLRNSRIWFFFFLSGLVGFRLVSERGRCEHLNFVQRTELYCYVRGSRFINIPSVDVFNVTSIAQTSQDDLGKATTSTQQNNNNNNNRRCLRPGWSARTLQSLDNGGRSSHPCPSLDCLKRWQSDHICHQSDRFSEFAT